MAPKKARDRKRQTKINFSPASHSSPATKSTAATNMGTSPSRPNLTATTPTRRAPSRVSNKSKNNKHDSSSEDELVVGTNKAMRLGMPVGGTARGMFDGSNNGSASSETSEEEDEVQVEQPKSRKRRRAPTPSESEDEEPTVTVIPRKRQRRVIEIGSDTSEKPKSKKKEEKKKTKSSKASKRRGGKESTSEEEELRPAPRSSRRKTAEKAPTPDEDEEEDEPLTPAPSSRRRIVRRRSPSAEEEEQSPPRSTRRRLKRRKSLSEDEEEPSATPLLTNRGDSASDDEDEEEGKGSANNDVDDEEQDELKEELAFLRSSPLPDRGRLRSTQGKPKNKRQEALEALKRRRAGTNEPSSSATPGRKRALVIETDSESELEVIKEEPDSDLEILEQDDIEDDEQESDRDANALDMFQEDQEDEHFIDDDPDNVIGEPSVNDDLDEMRLAFSLSRAKTRDLFKHAVEWMVMKKIHPAFDAEKNVYVLTFRKLDDEVKGLAGSKYTSSAWTADFTRAIRARPLLLMNELSAAERAVMSPHCEACNRTNHTASFEVLFQGQPYHPETLEPLANASDDSDSDSDSALSADSETNLNGEKPTFNYQGDRIPPESHRFPLGSTCKANAQVAHTLYHWRYNLYQWVKDYLKDEGHLTAEKLVKRDGRSDRKREKEARKIVDTMEENGRIRQLYHSYKDQLRAAVEADNDYANGWGRRG